MATSPDYITYVCDQLAGFQPLRYRKICCQNRHNRSPVFGAASAFFLPDPLQNLLSCRFSTDFQISGCPEI